jgi:hypothetical protein
MSSSINNCNASLPREGCACATTCRKVHRSQCKQLLRFRGVSDGLANSPNITMRHCKEKVVHVLLFVIHFVVLDIDDYFALVAF